MRWCGSLVVWQCGSVAVWWWFVMPSVHVRQGVDLGRFRVALLNVREACQRVRAINVHRARATDALAARAAEGEGRVLLVLDLDQSIQDHRTALCGEGEGDGAVGGVGFWWDFGGVVVEWWGVVGWWGGGGMVRCGRLVGNGGVLAV